MKGIETRRGEIDNPSAVIEKITVSTVLRLVQQVITGMDIGNRKDNPVKGSETSWDRTRSRRFPTGKDRPAKSVGGMYREKGEKGVVILLIAGENRNGIIIFIQLIHRYI